MVVFRICDKEEIDKIFSSDDYFDFGTSGSYFIEKNEIRQLNYNKYDPSKKYLHFFKLKEGIEHCEPLKGRYVCIYNIPDDILKQSRGRGIYKNLHIMADRLDLDEYAIESAKLNKSYLIRIELLTQTIDYRDKDFMFTDDTFKIVYDTPEAEELIKEYNKTELDEMIKNTVNNLKRFGLYAGDDDYYDKEDNKIIKR